MANEFTQNSQEKGFLSVCISYYLKEVYDLLFHFNYFSPVGSVYCNWKSDNCCSFFTHEIANTTRLKINEIKTYTELNLLFMRQVDNAKSRMYNVVHVDNSNNFKEDPKQ